MENIFSYGTNLKIEIGGNGNHSKNVNEHMILLWFGFVNEQHRQFMNNYNVVHAVLGKSYLYISGDVDIGVFFRL